MANRFWVGGTNTWNATAGTKWATTSGGAGGAAIPTTGDDVFFDGNSGAAGITVTFGAGIACKSLDQTGFKGTTAGGTALTVSAGSLTWADGVGHVHSYTGTITMADTSGATQTIKSNGNTWLGALTINGVSGVFQLSDSLLMPTKAFTLTAGAFDQNGKVMSSLSIAGSGSGVRAFTHNAEWTVTGAAVTNIVDFTTTTNLTFTSTSAAKLIVDATGNATNHTFVTGNQTWNDFSFIGTGTGNLTVSGTPTFRDTVCSCTGGGTFTLPTTVCRGLDFTGFTGIFAGILGISFSGDLTLAAGMTYSSTGTLSATATSGTQTITFNGITISGQLNITGAGGTRQFADVARFSTAATNLSIQAGTFIDNGFAASFTGIVNMNSSTTRVVTKSGNWTLSGTGNVWNPGTTTNLTFTDTGEIILLDASATAKSFSTNGLAYNIVRFKGTVATTYNVLSGSGAGSFFHVDVTGAAHTVVWPQSVTQTFSVFGPGVTGPNSSGTVITHKSASAGTQAIWSKAGNRVVGDWASYRDIKATGGGYWYVGRNSVNVSGNSGLRFTGLILSPLLMPHGSSAGTILKVALIADSFGHGQTDTNTLGGFSPELYSLLLSDNITGTAPAPYVFEWIGPLLVGPPPTNRTDAVPGSSTTTMLNGSTSPPAPVACTPVSSLFGPGNPFPVVDVFIVGPIGHNDSAVSYSNTVGTTSGIIPLILQLNTLVPTAFFVSTSVGGDTTGTFDTMFAFWTGTAQPTLTTALGANRIEYADVYSGYVPADFATSGHWSPTGYSKTAGILHEPCRKQFTRALGGTP